MVEVLAVAVHLVGVQLVQAGPASKHEFAAEAGVPSDLDDETRFRNLLGRDPVTTVRDQPVGEFPWPCRGVGGRRRSPGHALFLIVPFRMSPSAGNRTEGWARSSMWRRGEQATSRPVAGQMWVVLAMLIDMATGDLR